jgi:glycosyltransferase involved in cell wall biosynthesis
VVATAVGGIPEQIDSLDDPDHRGLWPRFGADKATGVLVPEGDGAEMTKAILRLLEQDGLRARLSENASCRARRDWDERRMVEAYLHWYRQITVSTRG